MFMLSDKCRYFKAEVSRIFVLIQGLNSYIFRQQSYNTYIECLVRITDLSVTFRILFKYEIIVILYVISISRYVASISRYHNLSISCNRCNHFPSSLSVPLSFSLSPLCLPVGMWPVRPDSTQQTAAPPSSHQPADQQGDAHESRSREPVQVRR